MRRVFYILLLCLPFLVLGQAAKTKEVNQQIQTWLSLNTLTRFSDRWGVVADVHLRSNEFFDSTNFFFLRGGISYIPNSLVSITGGYAHMWLYPTKEGWTTISNEDRIYQQVQLNTKAGKVGIVQRLRNEQRWQEKIANDELTGELRFTDRVRYLITFNIPVFKKKTWPLLVVSDEILIHFGQDVVYNTFDQNRLFLGIKQQLTPQLSFDLGYMNVYQEKYSGYQYDMNHTIRLFFYLNTAIKHNVPKAPEHHSGDE